MLGYQNTNYAPRYNRPPVDEIGAVTVPAPVFVDHHDITRTPATAANISTDTPVRFDSANWQSATWTFEPFTVVTWRVLRIEHPRVSIYAGAQLVARLVSGSGWIGGVLRLDSPETKISVGDNSGSRVRLNVWVSA